MRPEWVLLGILGAMLLGGSSFVQRRERGPSAYWIGGWISGVIGGLLTLLAPTWPALGLLSFPFGTLFSWFLLAGALVLAGPRVPAGLLPFAVALGTLRAVLAGWVGEPAAELVGLGTDLPAVLAAAYLARRAVPGEDASPTQRLLAPALLVLAGVGAFHLVWRATGGAQEWILTLWMLATPPLLGLQLRVGAEWTRRDLVRARRELERTIEQRTAELARVNASLRKSEERYRTLSELSSDLGFAIRVRPSGALDAEWVTDAFPRLTGFAKREMIGDRWLALVHPDDHAAVRAAFFAAREAGTGTFSFRAVRKDGRVRWLEVRERVTRDEQGLRVVGAARDVTEAREAEQQRLQLERQVQEAQRLESLGLVTSGVAHDFNNVLGVILGNGRLALADLPASHAARPRVERMLAAAEHGAGLTEQMLVYAGRAPKTAKLVNLSALIADMLDLARASLPAQTRLRETLAPDVWVQGDETQLRQVVLNLVANAGEALGEQAGTVELSTRVVHAQARELARARGAADLTPGRYARLEVADDGPGMDDATRERVFEPFFSTKLSGRGLGLAAVLGIVRGHGGAVEVSSALGRGSRFRVLLPSAAEAEVALERRAPAEERPGRRGARVLVIDDQEPVLELAREFLERAGHQVETALGGSDGLAHFEAAPDRFEAVILDLAMPDLDGEQVGRAIRSLRPDVPLLLVTGAGSDLATTRSSALQPAGFVRKPYGPEELVAALGQLLGRRDVAKDIPATDR